MDRYLLLAVGSLVGLGIGIGVLGERIATASTPPMPCREDEAMIWVDAPHTVRCTPIDDLTTTRRRRS